MNERFEKLLSLACASEANVLVTGPTGSGKSSLARHIHERSPRKGKPFVTVNLATMHEGTLESELFGHERGAFTSADHRRIGKLEAAQGGTVFLDEIGELSTRLQARLLEFLQSRTVSPVGSNREIRLNVRVIAATHRNLPLAVARGEFREDLFHRLRVIPLRLKSLAERPEEFDAILHSILEELTAVSGRKILRISEDVALKLESHSWPGNFRELRNLLEFSVLASDGPEITLSDLPPWFFDPAERHSPKPLEGVAESEAFADHKSAVSTFEKRYLAFHLGRNGGRISRTARQIRMSKATLIRRMRAYGLSTPNDAMCNDLGAFR